MVEDSVEVILDDFFVVGDTFDDCFLNHSKALQRCGEANLVLNLEKCYFIIKEGTTLGNMVSKKGIDVYKAMIEVTKN